MLFLIVFLFDFIICFVIYFFVYMKKKDLIFVLETLGDMYPDAKTELNYSTPFQLLMAVILSAQATDKQVNKVSDKLFLKVR